MTNLESFQRLVAWALIALGGIHVPVLVATSLWLNRNVVATSVIALLLAALPAILMVLKRPLLMVAYALAVSLVGQSSLLVNVFSGHPWQIEMHFYYFAVLAMMSGFCDWRVLLVTAGLIAMHHISLDLFLPEAIYTGGSNFARVAVHALIVVIETVMLMGIGIAIRAAFASAQEAKLEAEHHTREMRQLAAEREKNLKVTTHRAERMSELLDRFKSEIAQSIDILHGAASELKISADNLGSDAERANAQSTSVAAASQEMTIKMDLASHAGGALAQTIAEVGEHAAHSSKLAAEAVHEAQNTSSTIDEMASVAQEIENVTGLINAIAGQTNLLALNATIEAARAGEFGRGFAVVAQEVKALAAQTAKATQDIATRIAAMQGATSRSVEAIQAISGTIRQLDLFSSRIAASVEEQANSARDIAGNVHAAAGGVAHVSDAIGQIEGIADKTARAATQLSAASVEVARQTHAIRERVHAFAQHVEAMQSQAG